MHRADEPDPFQSLDLIDVNLVFVGVDVSYRLGQTDGEETKAVVKALFSRGESTLAKHKYRLFSRKRVIHEARAVQVLTFSLLRDSIDESLCCLPNCFLQVAAGK